MRLKELRKKAHLTQHELATIIGVSRSTVAMWESGLNEPDNKTLLHLALFFNCTVDYLLGRVEERVDDTLLDIVNEIPDDKLVENGNLLDALRSIEQDPDYDSDRRYDDSPSTVQEIELLTIYRSLNDLGQQTLIGTARGLYVTPNMKKEPRRVPPLQKDSSNSEGTI